MNSKNPIEFLRCLSISDTTRLSRISLNHDSVLGFHRYSICTCGEGFKCHPRLLGVLSMPSASYSLRRDVECAKSLEGRRMSRGSPWAAAPHNRWLPGQNSNPGRHGRQVAWRAGDSEEQISPAGCGTGGLWYRRREAVSPAPSKESGTILASSGSSMVPPFNTGRVSLGGRRGLSSGSTPARLFTCQSGHAP